MSFFRSFFGICRGPYIIRDLQKHSWARVIVHLLLLCLLCSVIIGIGNYLLLNYRWRAAYADFIEIYGPRLNVSQNGFIPARSPDVSRRQELPYNTLLIYVSPSGPEVYPDITLRDRNLIVLWGRGCLAMFIRNGDLWSVVRYNPDGSADWPEDTLDFEEMKAELDKLAQLPASDKWQFPEQYKQGVSVRQLFFSFRFSYALIMAGSYFLLSLGMVLLVTFFFTSVFKLFSFNRAKMLPFGILWKTALYVAFPVLLVVSFFPALQLPGTGYYTNLFLFGWAGYIFYVLRYLVMTAGEDGDEVSEGKNE